MSTQRITFVLASLFVLLNLSDRTVAFTTSRIVRQQQQYRRWAFVHVDAAARSRSVVEDPDGPTPVIEQGEIEKVDPDDIEGLREVMDPSEFPRPIPHQPWRRGDTAGCEAPITAQWRKDAEEEIIKAVTVAGGKVLDITWFLTAVLVTLDDNVMPEQDYLKDRGPLIDIIEPGNPMFYDPLDPEPEDIWEDEDNILYQRETEEDAVLAEQRRHNMYATVADDDDDPDETHIPDAAPEIDDVKLYMNEETRTEVASYVATEYQQQREEDPQEMPRDTYDINTAALSAISRAILESLKVYEDEWNILSRHDLILTSPNPAPDVIETQKQFDTYRDYHVVVETIDPFESNRTLKGQIIDRNSMDLLLNIKGRMVTVPHNFIKCVRLPPNNDDDYDEYEETEYDDQFENDDSNNLKGLSP